MRSRATLTTAILLLMPAAVASVHAAEVVLWDNYPDDVLQDPTFNMSSERNTQIAESTWVVDDVDLGEGAGERFDPADYSITRLEWIGVRHPDYSYGEADVIMFNDFPNLAIPGYSVEYEEAVSYSLDDLDPDPNPEPNAATYKGTVTFETPLSIADLGLDSHFYIGVRLVGDGFQQGRNHFATSSIDSTLRGQTEGYAWAPSFGAPYWRPTSDVWHGVPDGSTSENFEFAFRVFGVPEPTSLGLLVIGGLWFACQRSLAKVRRAA